MNSALSIAALVTLLSPILAPGCVCCSVQELGFKEVDIEVRDSEFRKGGEMATKKAVGRIVHFANLPLKLLLPSSRENITEVAFKTIPSASKVRNLIPCSAAWLLELAL